MNKVVLALTKTSAKASHVPLYVKDPATIARLQLLVSEARRKPTAS